MNFLDAKREENYIFPPLFPMYPDASFNCLLVAKIQEVLFFIYIMTINMYAKIVFA